MHIPAVFAWLSYVWTRSHGRMACTSLLAMADSPTYFMLLAIHVWRKVLWRMKSWERSCSTCICFFLRKKITKMYYPRKSTQWSVLDSANWRLLAGGSMPPVYPLLPPSVNQMSMIVQYDLAFYHGCVHMHNMASLLKIGPVRTYISS